MRLAENQYYHIYNRGNNKENIFLNRSNYSFFLNNFFRYLHGNVDVYAYCLMPNHFHFLLKIKPLVGTKSNLTSINKTESESEKMSPVEKGFKDFFISYSKSFNKLYQRTGSLFQYKFKRKLIDNEHLLRHITAYIHQNPVRWGLCENVDQWEFSSYKYILSNLPSKIKKDEVLKWFNGVNGFIIFHEEYRDHIRENEYLFSQENKDYKSLNNNGYFK